MYVHGCGELVTFNSVFEFRPIASKILTLPSRYKRAESNFLVDKKDPCQRDQVVFWVISLYLYIYYWTGLFWYCHYKSYELWCFAESWLNILLIWLITALTFVIIIITWMLKVRYLVFFSKNSWPEFNKAFSIVCLYNIQQPFK